MAATLTKRDREIFEGKNFAHLVTLMPDGSPHASPVWIDIEGDTILVNAAEGRVKTKNIRRDPRVAISILDSDHPYGGVVLVRGTVKEVTHDGADDHIDKLARKYTNRERYPWRQPGEQRVLFKIEPEHVVHAAR